MNDSVGYADHMMRKSPENSANIARAEVAGYILRPLLQGALYLLPHL
jgi:hypothetical protein